MLHSPSLPHTHPSNLSQTTAHHHHHHDASPPPHITIPTTSPRVDPSPAPCPPQLQQPGMQQVVLHTMINDPEIRDILVSQDEELERFLQQGGIIPGGLLTEGDGSSRAGEIQMQQMGSHAAGEGGAWC
jgi:hypothetical protein